MPAGPLRVTLAPYQLPLRRPIRTARGELRDRTGVIVRVERDGVVGIGEAAPLPGFSAEALDDVVAALADWRPIAPGSPDEAEHQADLPFPSARHGAEQALLDWLAARSGRTLADVLAANPRERVPVNAIALDADDAVARVADGFRCLKIKVAVGSVAEDVARVGRIRAAVGGDVALRLDANQGWSEPDADRALSALAPLGIELVEEPVADVAAMRRLRGRIPLAADERLVDEADLADVIARRAADVVVIKPMRVGGLRRSVRMIEAARRAGLDVVVTTSFDAAPGRLAALAVASTFDGRLACGLATGDLLERDVAPGFAIEAGEAIVPRGGRR